MKKEEIVALGVAEDIAQKIVELNAEELKGYIPKTRFDEVNEAKKNAEALVKERDGQLEALKKTAGDSEGLQKQIEELQEANKNAAKEYATKLEQMQKDNAVEKAISERRGKNATAIKALLDQTKIKVNEDGTTSGLIEQLDALVKAESSSFLFESGVPTIQGMVPANGKTNPNAETDLSKMNYQQLCEYMAANPDAQIS